jgi:peptidoglycan/LPS O-acetylase OafA/YrhL
MTEPDPTRTPPTVIAAVAAGTVVVPFLIVYSFLFIVRGAFVHTDQPDITDSRSGELAAGLIALCFLIFVLWGMGRLLNGWDRWVFGAGQLITFAAALDLLLDVSSGEPEVPAVVMCASLLAMVLTCVPPSWRWVRTAGGQRLDRAPDPAPRPDEATFDGGPAFGDPAAGRTASGQG